MRPAGSFDVEDGATNARGAFGRGGLALVALACALYVAARLWRLDASCLWFDELFGLHAARLGWGALARFVALDLIHPPLFYWLLKLWIAAGGESVWWLRLFPVAAATLALLPFALLWRELRLGARTLQLAFLLAAASGFLIKYAQEVRMYAPLLLFAACSLWLFARFCRPVGDVNFEGESGGHSGGRERDAPRTRRLGARLDLYALTAANLLLVYTHYFGWLLVALELAYVVAWGRARWREFVASAAVVATLFAPWAWAVLTADAGVAGVAGSAGGGVAQNIGWAARPRTLEIFQPYLLLHEPFRFQRHSHEPPVLRFSVVLTFALFAAPLAALAWRTVRGARDAGGRVGDADSPRRAGDAGEGSALAGEGFALRFLVFFSFAPVAVAFLLSHLLPHSVWGTRHLVIVAPAYLLLAAHAFVTLRPRPLAAAACLLLGCWLALAAAVTLTRPHAPVAWCSWETLARQLKRDDGNAADEADGDAADDAGATVGRRATKVYAFEDLAAYHLWHALGQEGGGSEARFSVTVVKNVPGLDEDAAFFLPRGFDEVGVTNDREAFREDDFWIAFRAASWDEGRAPVKTLAARGYTVERRYEASAQGQTAFLARVRKR